MVILLSEFFVSHSLGIVFKCLLPPAFTPQKQQKHLAVGLGVFGSRQFISQRKVRPTNTSTHSLFQQVFILAMVFMQLFSTINFQTAIVTFARDSLCLSASSTKCSKKIHSLHYCMFHTYALAMLCLCRYSMISIYDGILAEVLPVVVRTFQDNPLLFELIDDAAVAVIPVFDRLHPLIQHMHHMV
eukprot:g12965.t1